MSVSLKYLLKDIKKNELELIAGEKGLKNKVRWTHIVESEEIANFLQGEEMVFTTGIAIKNQNDLFRLIKITKNQNASGVVINTGKYINNVDKEIIDYCNENNYPLFLMPWEIRMAEIMKDLTITILESERTYLEVSNAIKDAIFLSKYEELYINTLEKDGFKSSWKYILTIL